MAKSVSKEIPLSEITLRKYERPYELKGRELVKKLCLSIGLLQPGDSRDVIVDVLEIVANAKNEVSSEDVEKLVSESRKKAKLPMLGIAPSNIRRQLKRLRDLFIIDKVANRYRIAENAKLNDLFTEKIEQFYLKTIVERVREYFDAVQQQRKER